MSIWKEQTMAKDCHHMTCLSYDPIKNFEMEASGYYVLIHASRHDQLIEVAICNKEHVITHTFAGKTCQALYHSIFTYEKEHELNWFTNKEHMAYLGKELKKCELALSSDADKYYQE